MCFFYFLAEYTHGPLPSPQGQGGTFGSNWNTDRVVITQVTLPTSIWKWGCCFSPGSSRQLHTFPMLGPRRGLGQLHYPTASFGSATKLTNKMLPCLSKAQLYSRTFCINGNVLNLHFQKLWWPQSHVVLEYHKHDLLESILIKLQQTLLQTAHRRFSDRGTTCKPTQR